MFVIQDPTREHSPYLLDSLREAFDGAVRIAGAFAFASSAGVRLLAEVDTFRLAADSSNVELVIGTDAVTNERALDSLLAVVARHSKIQARAFVNPLPGTVFHPKFCWVERADGGHLVVGSGNLTERGLLGNWEAYSATALSPAQTSELSTVWGEWTARHDTALRPLDDAEVRRRVRANTVMAPVGDWPTIVAPPDTTTDPEPLVAPTSARVLIAEVPRSGDRWKQVNFLKDDYRSYFGVRPGEARLFVFRHVGTDGTLDDYEQVRPPVTVRSQNYRFELGAAGNQSYPDTSPPIAAFLQMTPHTFYYHLMLPGDMHYQAAATVLSIHAGERQIKQQRSDRTVYRMRSCRLSDTELRME